MSARPPPFAAKFYGVEDGLPDPVAAIVLQTRDGFIWVGTDNGLARFDGIEFTMYRAALTPGLSNDTIRYLFEDAEGTLWIATQAGLSFYKEGKFEQLVSLATPITAVAVDRSRRLWIGTRTKGLLEYKEGQLRDFNAGLKGSANMYVRSLFEDSAGRMWVGLGGGGPAYVDGDHLTRLDNIDPRYQGTSAFAEYPQGTLWFGTGPLIFRLRGGELTRYGKEQGLSDDLITSLCTDGRGQIWAAGRRLWRLEGVEAAAFVPVAVPDLDQCRQIAIDHEGSYWVGTAGFGLVKLRPSAFEHLVLPGLGVSAAKTLAVDQEGVLSLGLVPEGVLRMGPDGTNVRIETGPPPENDVQTVYSTRDGRLWIGRHSSLLVWNKGEIVDYAAARGVRAIYEDAQGIVWLGTDTGGILRLRNGAFERMNAALGIREGMTASAFAEMDGALFIGLRWGGLLRLSNDAGVKHYDVVAGTPLDMIRSLLQDRDGHLWVGTRGHGLALFRDGQLWNPQTLSEPFQGLVSALEIDNVGHLFVGSSRGILWGSRDDALSLAKGERLKTLFQRAGETEGIKPATVGFGAQPTSAKGPDGRLWFATRTGVIVVDPSRLVTNTAPPPVHILRTSIEEHPVTHRENTFEIQAGATAIRIDYTAPSFARPDMVQFRYRMEDHDTTWVEAGTRRSAYYSNLIPGKHHFQVIAANESGVWNTVGASLTVVQRPHFYQTLWFRLLATLTFTAAIALAVRRWTQTNLKRRLDVLEAERRLTHERGRIARDLHDEIGSSVTKIGYLVDRLEQQSPDERTHRLQQQLSWQTRLLASDLDRVVWSVSPANPTLGGLAGFISRFVQTFLRETSVQCTMRTDTTLPPLPITPEMQHHVLAVTKEAINNALKHAKPAHVFIKASFTEGNFFLAIRDDGLGFDVNSQTHSERNGLSNMRARAKEIGGELGITSAPGQGTELVLKIPIPFPAKEKLS